MQDLIQQSFTESIQTKIVSADILSDVIERAGQLMVSALLNDKKIICCGDGFSHGVAASLSAALVHQFENTRPSLPALTLQASNLMMSALASNEDAEYMFANQLKTLAVAGDILVIFASHMNSPVLLRTMEAAVATDMLIVAITGGDGGEVAGLLSASDIEVRIPSSVPIRIVEIQQLIAHCLCHAIENTLFPGS